MKYQLKIHQKIVLILLMAICISAQGNNIPAKVQVAIFSKILPYDRTISGKSFQVLIVYNNSPGQLETALESEFKGAGINAQLVENSQLVNKVNATSVVYIPSGINVAEQLLTSKGALSITNDPSMVEKGNASLGIMIEGEKPKIVVNTNRLKSEKHEIASELLKIAKVY